MMDLEAVVVVILVQEVAMETVQVIVMDVQEVAIQLVAHTCNEKSHQKCLKGVLFSL